MALASNDMYGGVVVTAFLIAFEYVMIMESLCIINRKRHFSKEFLNEHFGEEHKKAFGTEIKGGGYPDHGTGKYSEKMPYKAWVEFCNAQRAYYNFLELFFPVLVPLLIAGLAYPTATIIEGVIFMIARLLYAIGYTSSKGGDGRYIGALLGHLCAMAIFVTAVLSGLKVGEVF